MATKPDKLPEFAVDNAVDPDSGKNNVIEPGTEQKSKGWFPFRKRPERNILNWLHRKTYEWLKHYDDTYQEGTYEGVRCINSNDPTSQPQNVFCVFDLKWRRTNDFLQIILPAGIEIPQVSPPGYIGLNEWTRLYPASGDSVFPEELQLDNGAINEAIFRGKVWDDSGPTEYEYEPCRLSIPNGEVGTWFLDDFVIDSGRPSFGSVLRGTPDNMDNVLTFDITSRGNVNNIY